MSLLPTTGTITPGTTIEQSGQPTLTWYIDPQTQQVKGKCDGYTATAQTVEALLNIERFAWPIYPPEIGIETTGLIGQDPGYVASELQRRIEDAVLVDDRVTGIQDFSYTFSGGVMTATVTVNTVYGSTQTQVEVVLQ